jgi:glucose-1-phosphate cytidylyltransferase
MKAIILAGGLGTRLSEETHLKPKPMVEIGDKPILWHVMKIYESHGVSDFIICLGYKGELIKEYFQNYALRNSDVTFDMRTGEAKIHRSASEDWCVTLIDTGETAMTGARVRKVLPFVENDDAFCLTYGDGVADVDVTALIDFHHRHGKIATVTAVAPPGRFGALRFARENKDRVSAFVEKPEGDGGLINGGFFVLSPKVGDYLSDSDEEVWEKEPLVRLAKDGELMAFRHRGFWRPMDTLRDRVELEALWSQPAPPWKSW